MQMPDSPHFWHFNNMRVLPREIYGVTVIRGAETNIYNYEGELDIGEDILKNLEWVVASYHKYTFPNYAPADHRTARNCSGSNNTCCLDEFSTFHDFC